MKPSKGEMTLSILGCLFGFIALLSEPLRLSEALQWCVLILAPACFISLIVLQRRRRNARIGAGLPAAEKPPPKRRFWLLLSVIIATSLSGPLWLPYTDSTLPASTLIVTSIISCAFAIVVFLLSWRYWHKRSNQALQPTAGRSND
jgi:hypothetical protein